MNKLSSQYYMANHCSRQNEACILATEQFFKQLCETVDAPPSDSVISRQLVAVVREVITDGKLFVSF